MSFEFELEWENGKVKLVGRSPRGRCTWSTNRHKFSQIDMCGYVQNGGESLLFLAVERWRGVERRRIVSRVERAETCRMAANRFFF